MFVDSVLSIAFDRRPVSFLPVGYCIFKDPSNTTSSSFHERMYAIHALKLAWQKASAEDPTSICKIHAIEPYINALEDIDQATQPTISKSSTQSSIQERLEYLMYRLYVCCFRSKLARSACLSRCPSDNHRRIFFESMTFNLKEVINAFLSLKQLSPVATISWDTLHRTMTSALVLTSVEVVLGAGDSRELLRKLIRSLSPSSERDSETFDLIVAPYSHGLETLQYSVDKLAYNA